MPKITVNGNQIEFEQGMTVLQACELAGEEIPRFCYHERLKIAGNCRMCLVQVEGGPPKPAASCAMPAGDGMVVHTNSPMVKKAREGVMEFLLMNHPLDCPICDQGGECDLQDQAMAYGRGDSRFEEDKRAVKDKYMGPLVKTHMTRCIQCTRCIRFLEDVAGVCELGAVNRGEHMEVTTYVEKSLTSEMSGNIIDLCPVGALTSKPYAFKARPWELNKTESIDVLDAVGSNIRVDSRGKEVVRILPRLNEDINEEWISDKTRFAYDGLKVQRLDKPYVRVDGKLKPASWNEAYKVISDKMRDISSNSIAAIAGDLADCESMYALKKLMTKRGVNNIDCRQDGMEIGNEGRSSYIFNTTIQGIENADLCLLVGTNPRREAAIINSRIRKANVNNGLKIASIGGCSSFTYPVEKLGNSPKDLQAIADGKSDFCKTLEAAKNPMIIIGSSALCRDDAEHIMYLVSSIAVKYNMVREDWNGFNVLHKAASRVGGLDMGFLPSGEGVPTKKILKECEENKIEFLYLLGADEIDMSKLGKAFVVYQGHHGDSGAHRADVILPGAAYTEKSGTYVNTEGRVQRTSPAIYPLGEAKEDWLIIKELAMASGISLNFNNIDELRESLERNYPVFANEDIVSEKWNNVGKKGVSSDEPFRNSVKNFYMSDPISRASKTMAACSSEINKGCGCKGKSEEKEAA
ncbi:MAG: NADH-quinone oxidoreductase subunit NuoG [Rickettsiales bacterium]|nr:NADH-quinone oxidoreductase subunit NuoG [Pseudomonadota bacterium]MDA0966684.1 NADH-quinone oxidoreductase subunit NuoG [Pseudomonadota bacterium]MDG4543712.1 NADH-quinone oxidoreductase subunit NuoG [Rickettsiales bacterium]MDG4545859.1 NADH-quinone oxidoreductase subunit NuoG [Rickettsiales bacterium]MDG4547367.1 NADH-quinone oxidoreductase subunit NuoG [Rickettsiales bacterium]